MEPSKAEIKRIETALKDLDLDYMRGLLSEEEYETRAAELRKKLEELGGQTSRPSIAATSSSTPRTTAPKPTRKAMTDPVTAVKDTIQKMRRLPIEKIAQESGVKAIEVNKIISDLLDGRELSGRLDHDHGDFILGTGTGPAPKTIAACPYCKTELQRIAVRGETVTCKICRESFIVS